MSHGAPLSREGVWDCYVLLTVRLIEGFWQLERKHAALIKQGGNQPGVWALSVVTILGAQDEQYDPVYQGWCSTISTLFISAATKVPVPYHEKKIFFNFFFIETQWECAWNLR
jgi:hypothetical protein